MGHPSLCPHDPLSIVVRGGARTLATGGGGVFSNSFPCQLQCKAPHVLHFGDLSCSSLIRPLLPSLARVICRFMYQRRLSDNSKTAIWCPSSEFLRHGAV